MDEWWEKNILIVLILINTISLFAGKYAGDFMSMDSGVKALSMGGAYAAVADEGSAIYWNGSIGQIRNKEFSLMRAFLYDSWLLMIILPIVIHFPMK